jgi:sporulation protein YlmC with PRC-barrel domain
LIAAACSGQTATPVQETQAVLATEPVAATEVATEAPTEAATDAATEAATEAATTAPETQQPAATAEGTSAAVDTPGAGETAMPATDIEELLVQSSNLIGMDIQAIEGVSLGTIRDVLIDETGAVKYIVVELPAIGGNPAQNVIVDFSLLQTVVADANLEDVQLNFSGTPADLANAVPVELTEELDAIINTTGTDLPEELNDLVSLANVNALALQDTAAEELGMLQDTLIDLQTGQVDFVVLDLSAVGGAAETTVMVPWERLNVDPAAAAEAQAFVLDVTQDTLQNAPPIDLSELPTFIDPNQVNWETIMDFWESLS